MTYEDYDAKDYDAKDYESIEPFEIPSEPEPPDPVFLPPVSDPEILRVLAVGSRPVVNRFVHRLHRENIAHYSEWTRLLPTPNPGEFMRMLTKRIPLNPDTSEVS